MNSYSVYGCFKYTYRRRNDWIKVAIVKEGKLLSSPSQRCSLGRVEEETTKYGVPAAYVGKAHHNVALQVPQQIHA